MYINSRAYPRAYREILNSARASASTSNAGQVGVLVLVAPDVDALCACRILVGLLRHDQIGHNVVPVAGWSELARVNREMVEGNTKVSASERERSSSCHTRFLIVPNLTARSLHSTAAPNHHPPKPRVPRRSIGILRTS
jgi:hypothetical protein